MTQTAIFWPMLAQVALVYAVYAVVSRRRVAAIKAGHARTSQFRENRDEPPESLFARNNLVNQFELPVLFYAACLSLFVTGSVGAVSLALAWIFALSRYVHAAIHVTTNRIRHRRPAFVVGYVSLAGMWLWLALRLIGAG